MMGFNEDYVLTMSGSRRNGSPHDHKDSDCNLVIWEEFDLALPRGGRDKRIKKNYFGGQRNCVHPKLLQDPDDEDLLWVMTITEYYSDTYTGFTYMMLNRETYGVIKDPDYTMSFPETRIEDRAFKFTSAYCPSPKQWYAVGTYDVSAINIVVHFNWGT